MGMVVRVHIDSDLAGGAGAEQRNVFGMAAHRFGCTRAADMAVEADHTLGCGHHDVQIVRDDQHAAAVLVTDLTDKMKQLELARDVNLLGRLVEHQEVGFTQ